MREKFVIVLESIFKKLWIFVIIFGIMLRIKKAEKAPGIINMANRSHAPAILTIDMDNMKNNGMTNNGLTLLLIFLNENAPIIINGNIIGNKK